MEMDIDRVEGGSTGGATCEEGGGILIPVESPRIGCSQVAVLEDAQTLYFSNVSKNS